MNTMTIDEFVSFEIDAMMKFRDWYAEQQIKFGKDFPEHETFWDWLQAYSSYVSEHAKQPGE